jgi:hypothetical protein
MEDKERGKHNSAQRLKKGNNIDRNLNPDPSHRRKLLDHNINLTTSSNHQISVRDFSYAVELHLDTTLSCSDAFYFLVWFL